MQSSSSLKLNSCFKQDGAPNEYSFRSFLGQEALEETIAKGITVSNNVDYCVWDLTYSGVLSLHSAWQLIRQRGVASHVAKNC